MNLRKYMWVVILIGAMVVRIYNLETVPYGFHIDEVKAGWNAWSILQTGRDDKGNLLPKYYDSFGDFRPTGLIYLIIPSLIVFGKTIFAVRLPFALIGGLTIVPLYFLTKEISKNKKIALCSMVLLAFNPWHIVVSRSTSESVIAIFLTLWGLYFFVKLFSINKWFNAVLSFICLSLAFGFYHNIRVLAPIFLLLLMVGYRFVLKRKVFVSQLLVFILLVVTSIWVFWSPESRGRMSQVGLRSDFQVLYETTKMPNEETPGHLLEARVFHNKISAYIRRFAEEYKNYFGTNFLTGDSAKPVRYMVPQVGLLTYVELILVIFGLFWVARKLELLPILLLMAIAPLPAAVTIEDVPNMQRAIFMVPFLMIVAAYGMVGISKLFGWQKLFRGMVVFLYAANFIYFVHMYFVHQKTSLAAYYRDGGTVELMNKLSEIRNQYKKIILTNSPDDLYPWIAFTFYNEAKLFNSSYVKDGVRQIDNFVFAKEKCPISKILSDRLIPEPDYLYVEAEGCIIDKLSYPKYLIKDVATIYRPDGSPPYYLRMISVK